MLISSNIHIDKMVWSEMLKATHHLKLAPFLFVLAFDTRFHYIALAGLKPTI